MTKVEKVSVALTPELAAAVHQVVLAGEYASVSEVMREALRDWKVRRTLRDQALEGLGRMWDAGLASGPAAPGEEAFARIRARLSGEIADRDPQ